MNSFKRQEPQIRKNYEKHTMICKHEFALTRKDLTSEEKTMIHAIRVLSVWTSPGLKMMDLFEKNISLFENLLESTRKATT